MDKKKFGVERWFGVVGAIGGIAMMRRLNVAIRPDSRYILAEIGIKIAEIGIGITVGEICERVVKGVIEGVKTGFDRATKEHGEAEKNSSYISNDGIHETEPVEPDDDAMTELERWIKDREEKGIYDDGNE